MRIGNLGKIFEALMEKRGLSGPRLEEFLDPSLKRLAKYTDLPGIAEAAEIILPFVRDRRKIVVFGDYDCDGVCASAILAKALARLGANVNVFLPERFTEGYGLTDNALKRLYAEIPDVALVITVDCGITSANEVADLKRRGIAVVVTDHHLPPGTLPECDAVVDMKLFPCGSGVDAAGAREVCGAGVAFFLANALVSRATELGMHDGTKLGAPLLVLAGLATVVDIVPLTGQNRILAANAIDMFLKCAPTGLKRLLEKAQRRAEKPTARDFGFLLGPRINAAGRIASAMEAFDLLMEGDADRVQTLVHRVDAHNAERKTKETNMIGIAQERIGDANPPAVVMDFSGCDDTFICRGASGNVAARLADRYGVPSAVVVDGVGSARAPEGFDVHAALSQCVQFLDRFGGHVAAAGFTVKDGKIREFEKAFGAACRAQDPEGRARARKTGLREPDLWISPEDVTLSLCREVQRMAPFGEGNPEPEFGLRGVEFSSIGLIGAEGKHAIFRFADGRIPRAVWWNRGNFADKLRGRPPAKYDVTFTIEESAWGGEEPHPELRLVSLAESAN